jgi:hypothetical protein
MTFTRRISVVGVALGSLIAGAGQAVENAGSPWSGQGPRPKF